MLSGFSSDGAGKVVPPLNTLHPSRPLQLRMQVCVGRGGVGREVMLCYKVV